MNNDAKHDLNSGPICPGEAGNSMLLYPTQGHRNEKYQYDASTGRLCFPNGQLCLGIVHGATPAPQPEKPRAISVSWAELGYLPWLTSTIFTTAHARFMTPISIYCQCQRDLRCCCCVHTLRLPADEHVLVRDLWAGTALGVQVGNFSAEVAWHEAKIYTFVPQNTMGETKQ